MKTQILTLLIIVGIGLLTSCKNDDSGLETNRTIGGTWNLKNVHGGLATRSIDFQKGDVKWTFNETNQILTVLNNIGNDKSFALHSGTYQYKIDQNGDNQVLFVNGNDYRMVILSIDKNLVISDDMLDGFTAEFYK